MKFSDFDKQIQENAARNLVAPSELDWDNMDITLPEKKSKKPLIAFLLMSVILVSGSVYYLYNQGVSEDILKEKQLSNTEAIAIQSNETTFDNSKATTDEIVPIDNNSISQKDIATDFQTSIESKKNIATDNNFMPQQEFSTDVQVSDETKENTTPSTNNASNQLNEQVENTNIQNEEQATQKAIAHHENMKNQAIEDVIQSTEFLTTLDYKSLNIDQKDLPLLSVFSENKSIRPRTNSLTILSRTNHTSNHFNTSNLEYLDVLNASDVSAWSQSLTIRKAFPLTKSLFGSVGLSYHKLHTVFSHSQYLGFEDVVNSVGTTERTERTRVVYHNNYSNIGALNIGLGKSYSIANQLDFQFQLGLDGGYQFSDDGKTLDTDLEIVDKALMNNNKFTLSTTADAHIVYNANSFKLLVGGGFSKFLTSTNSIDNTTLTNRPNMFFLDVGVGYQF